MTPDLEPCRNCGSPCLPSDNYCGRCGKRHRIDAIDERIEDNRRYGAAASAALNECIREHQRPWWRKILAAGPEIIAFEFVSSTPFSSSFFTLSRASARRLGEWLIAHTPASAMKL
jgi:hypothetical protein